MKKFNPKSMKAIKLKPNTKLFRIDPHDFFRRHEQLAQALSEALLEGDKDAFQEIISAYLSIINKEELSRKSKVPIATIRRMAAGSNYNIETLLKITAAINKAA
jgi:DNA-binding phage protein